jgi:DNA repair exonuclease SbcCD ATPase subunit
MRRRRNWPQSSLELFLDTICNTFGGILLIAILIAIQIRQTEESGQFSNAPSPETIIELQEELDQLTVNIKLSTTLRETLQKRIPASSNDNELAQNYDRLARIKEEYVTKKSELNSEILKQKNENIQKENQLQSSETNIQTTDNEIKNLVRQVHDKQTEQLTLEQTVEDLKIQINELNQQIAKKEKNLSQPETIRNDIFYLPKLRKAKTHRSVYFVLRYNRLYDAGKREDFDSEEENLLGTPKKLRGISVDTSDASKQNIQKYLQQFNNKIVYISILVYGDSADQFYLVRDVLLEAGFEYELIPALDDAQWSFSGQGGARNVQ